MRDEQGIEKLWERRRKEIWVRTARCPQHMGSGERERGGHACLPGTLRSLTCTLASLTWSKNRNLSIGVGRSLTCFKAVATCTSRGTIPAGKSPRVWCSSRSSADEASPLLRKGSRKRSQPNATFPPPPPLFPTTLVLDMLLVALRLLTAEEMLLVVELHASGG